MTTEEAARRLGVHKETVRVYIRAGRLEATMIDRQYDISEEALHRFVQAEVPSELRSSNAPRSLPIPDEYLLTSEQVGRLFGVTEFAVTKWIRDGHLKAIKPDRQWLVRYGDARRFRPYRVGRPFGGRERRALIINPRDQEVT